MRADSIRCLTALVRVQITNLNPHKDYFYSAIDAKAKFALTLNYKRRSSENMSDFYRRFKTVYPCAVKSWQSDNGGENLGEFGLEL
ncbi:MAG: hypothetical protein HY887_06385, partial [Deltaproteobacteria bacterium]|nr:hypothetical protein [Deltaproteobacteria bacterium]